MLRQSPCFRVMPFSFRVAEASRRDHERLKNLGRAGACRGDAQWYVRAGGKTLRTIIVSSQMKLVA